MSKDCNFNTSNEYNDFLKLSGNSRIIANSIWEATKGNVVHLKTLNDIKIAYKNIQSNKSKKVTEDQLPFKKMEDLNPAFVFNHEERNEITEALLYFAILDSNGNLKPQKEIDDFLKPANFEAKIKKTAKFFPNYADNYNKLLQPRVLQEFRLLVLDQLRDLNNVKNISDEEEIANDEDSKISNSNYTDSNLEDQVKKASASSKALIKFLPSGKRGTTLGMPTFANFTNSENLVLDSLKNITDRNTGRAQEILQRIEKLALKKPEFAFLLKKLRGYITVNSDGTESYSKELVQFIKTYDKNAESYTSSFLEEDENGNYINKIGSAETNSRDKQLIDNWSNNFESLFFTESDKGDIILNRDKVTKLIEDYRTIFENRKRATELTPEMVTELVHLLGRFGIKIDEGVITNNTDSLDSYKILLSTINKLVAKSGNSSASLTDLLEVKSFGLSKKKSFINNPIKDNSSLLSILAEEQVYFMSDMSGNTVWGGGKMYQKYVLYNYLKLIEIDLQKGEGSEHLAMLDRDLYSSNSRWKEEIRRGSKIKFELFNARKLAGTDSHDSKELGYRDEFVDRIERTLSGSFPFLTLADKGRVYYVTGMPFHNVENKELDDATVDIFTSYFFDELATMQQAWEDLYGEEAILDKDKVEYYHTKGNVFSSTLFPSLSPNGELTNQLKEQGIIIYQEHADIGKPFALAPSSFGLDDNGQLQLEESLRDQLRAPIRELLKKQIEKNKTQMIKDGIISKDSALISTTITDKYKSDKYNQEEIADKVATAFTINSLISNIEQTKLFTGDPRMYKTIEDFLKRTPAVSATGDALLVGGNVRPKFNVSIIQGFTKPSDYYTNSAEIEKLMLFSQNPNAIAKTLNLIPYDGNKNVINPVVDHNGNSWMPDPNKKNPYSKVNSTDAQAWISMDRFKEIVSGLDGWTEELEGAFQRIKSGNPTTEDYDIFINSNNAMQPKKGMHFELVEKGGKLVPVYLKYSQSILFPEIIAGNPELMRMSEMMDRDGIDEVVVTDGIKVGAFGVTDINQEGAILNPIELSNKYWKLQQDLPTDGLGNKLVLSQPKKNMIADIDLDHEYYPGMTGRDLVNQLHDVDVSLSDIGLANLRNEITEDGKISQRKIREKLIKEFKREGESQDLIRALQAGIHIDALPAYRRNINSKIANWYNKNAVKIKQNGGSGIQMSDLGFGSYKNAEGKYKRDNELTTEEKKGIIWLKDVDSLSPPSTEVDSDGNTTYKPGQILLNYSYAERIPNFHEIKHDRKKLLAAIDPELLRIVTSRVPNQKLSFNDSLEIVGFLPPHIGDTVVAYKEITTKTGSDFDIDKLYFMIPNYSFNKKNGRLEYVKYLDDTNSTSDERYNIYLENIKKSKEVKNELENLGLTKDEIRTISLTLTDEEFNTQYPTLKTFGLTITSILESLEEDTLIQSFDTYSNLPINEQNSKKALENRRIELYRKVLEHPSTMPRLISSVDNEWLKDFIDDIIPPDSIDNLDLYDGYFQMMKRREFLSSKGSVGQNANHIGDHAISQDAEIFLSLALGIGNETTFGDFDISKSNTDNFETYENGKIVKSERALITEILSVFMNSFVDAAKDNYIGRANFNSTTNNVAFMLMRGGVSPHFTVALLAQPIIREYVKRMDMNRGLVGKKTSKNQLLANLAKEMGFEDGLPTPSTKLGDFTTTDLINNIKNISSVTSIEDPEVRFNQVELLSIFVNVLEKGASALRDTVSASTADREGVGMNIVDANIRKNKVLSSVISPIVKNYGNKLTSKDGKKRMLGGAIENSIDAFIGDMGNEFLENTPGFNAIVNEIYRRLHNKIPNSVEDVNKISKFVYGTLMHDMSGFGLEKDELYNLLIGEKNLALQLKALKDAGYDKKNQLLDFLDFNINYSHKSPSFISINNTRTLTPKVKEFLTYSWLELYYNKDSKLRQFAKDLAHYSFYSSLFTDNLTSFYRLIPYEISRDLGISSELSQEMRKYLSSSDPSKYELIIDNVLRNSLTDGQISPVVAKKNAMKNFNVLGYRKLDSNKPISNLYRIINTREATNLITDMYENSEGEMEASYKPYISMYETAGEMPFTYQKLQYFKFIGTVKNEKGESYPFYLKTNKLGYKRGIHQVYEIDLSDKPKSIINSNNVNISKEVRDNIESFISNHVESFDISIETITPVTSIIEATDVTSTNPIQPTSVSKEVKPGVAELFEYNSELANQVYEALEFKTKADVILPIGTSGSGKSTFIKSLPQDNLVVIEPDAMRVEFTGDMNNKSKDKEIYEEAAKRAIAAIRQGKQVVFDTTNLTKDKRLPFIKAIKEAIPTANIQYKLMELNPELAKQRIKAQLARGENRAAVSDETIDRHAVSYKQMLEDIKNEPISNYEVTPQQKQQAQKNIFTVEPIQSVDKKAKSKAKIATQYIGFAEGIAGSSTALYAKQISEQSNKPNTLKEYADKTSAKFVDTKEILRKDDIEYYNERVNDLVQGRLQYAIFALEDLNNRQYLPFINKLKENGFKNVEGMEWVLSKGGKNPKAEYENLSNNNIVNSGNYSSDDVIFVSVPGKRGNEVVRKQQQDRTIREAIKALDAGATIVTDNAAYVESNPYNEGEKRLAANLKVKGYNYSEIVVDGHLLGVWNKNTNPITPEQKQQAQLAYSQYLDTVFPESKVKDIVYHGTENKNRILEEGFKNNNELYEPDDDRAYESGELGYGYYFAATIENSRNYGEPVAVLLNNPDITNETTFNLTTNEKGIQHFVKTKEQIHILGSKQDVEGFKEFVGKSTTQPSTKGSSLLSQSLVAEGSDEKPSDFKSLDDEFKNDEEDDINNLCNLDV